MHISCHIALLCLSRLMFKVRVFPLTVVLNCKAGLSCKDNISDTFQYCLHMSQEVV